MKQRRNFERWYQKANVQLPISDWGRQQIYMKNLRAAYDAGRKAGIDEAKDWLHLKTG